MGRRLWSKEEEDLLSDCHNKCMTIKETAILVGRSESSVSSKRDSMGLKYEPWWNEDRKQYLIDNHDKIRYEDMATELGKPKNDVYNQMKRMKLKIPEHLKKGAWHPDIVEYITNTFDENKKKKCQYEDMVLKFNHLNTHTYSSYVSLTHSMGLVTKIESIFSNTENKNKLKQLYNEGETLESLASEFECNKSTIVAAINSLGIEKRNQKLSDEDVEFIKSNYGNMETQKIADYIGRPHDTVVYIASKYKVKKQNYHWNEEDVETIVSMYKAGYSKKVIAGAVCRTESSVSTKLYKEGVLESRSWSEDELRILADFYETDEEYCFEKINRKRYSIRRKAISLGLQSKGKWKPHEDEYISNSYKTNSDQEMADYLGRTRRAIKWRRNVLGLEARFYKHYGNANEAKDGTMCLSYAELDITNFMHDNDIVYEKEIFYRDAISDDETRRRFDWVIHSNSGERYFVEYFGMYERPSRRDKQNLPQLRYRKKTKKKINDLIKAGLYDKCIFIFPCDLKNKSFEEIFSKVLKEEKK